MRRERAAHTLQTTALIHEAYIRLVEAKAVNWQNRAHFFAVTARVMRHILIDHARRRSYTKHGGEARQVPIEEASAMSLERAAELIALEEALAHLPGADHQTGGQHERKQPSQHFVLSLRSTPNGPGSLRPYNLALSLRSTPNGPGSLQYRYFVQPIQRIGLRRTRTPSDTGPSRC